MTHHARPGKHTVYYDLLDACKQQGCPICAVVLQTVERYLSSVLYESVNDPRIRDEVVAARGYCNDHSWQLREPTAGNALGVAIMYRDVLHHVRADIDRRPAGAKLAVFDGQTTNGGGLLDRLAALTGSAATTARRRSVSDPHSACPACQVRERYELVYLRELLAHLGEEEVVQAYRRSGGLCLVHLDQAARAARDAAALERLLALQRDCLQALQEELDEFIRKHDYRFRTETIGTEGTSWTRAIEVVAGKQGIR